MIRNLNKALITEDYTLRQAMLSMVKTGFGITLIIDKNKKLKGTLTDGDARRAILNGVKINSLAKLVCNKNPITASPKTPASQLLKKMRKYVINQIPIIHNGIVVDLALLQNLRTIPLSYPDITQLETDAIKHVLATPYLSIGPEVKNFEKQVARFLKVRHAIAVNSGTSGLHLCIRALGIKDGDEVITSPFSFIASANCILFERAKPVFVDIDKNTLCIDPDKIEKRITKKTKAILPIDIFGHPCDMDKIMYIAKKYNLAIIEDCCEAFGSKYNGKKVGSFGDCGVFAFYPNKQITTAEGGMIVTNNDKIANLCKSMRNQGREEGAEWLSHKILGYNYRMSELHAALGIAQMKRISTLLKKREKVAKLYNNMLKNIHQINLPFATPNVSISWFVYVIKLAASFSRQDRDIIITKLEQKGIACKNYFPPIHLEPVYTKQFHYKKGSYPITESVSDRTIALPFYNNLKKYDVQYIVSELKKIMENHIKKSK